jgi:hypothetical protein
MTQLKGGESHADIQFTAKSLQRQAKKANKDETTEKNKVKLVSDSLLLNHPNRDLKASREKRWIECDRVKRDGKTNTRRSKKEIQKEPKYTLKTPSERRPRD